MKLPLMIGILSSLSLGTSIGLGSIVENNNYFNPRYESSKDNLNIEFLNSMKCYIDGVNKIWFNNIEDTDFVTDSWSYNEAKTINISADLSRLDANTKFLEIEIPQGLKLMSTPESLLSDFLVSFDDSNFQTTNYNIDSGQKGNGIYTPNNGILRYEIAPSVMGLNLDILVAVDDLLWDGKSSSATPTDQDKIKITIGDSSNSKTLKLDRVNVNPVSFSPWYWSGSENTYLTQGIDKEYSQTILFSSDVRLFKNVTVEMEKPYIEKTENGMTTKKYIPIKNIIAGSNGTYTETSNSVIFSWDNVKEDRLSMKFTLNPSRDITTHGDLVKVVFKEAKFSGILSNQEYIAYRDKIISSTIVSDQQEHIVFSGQPHGAYKSSKEIDTLYNFGRLDLKNEGAPSNRKYLRVEFPIDEVGVKTFRLPAPKEAKNYNLEIELWNRKTNESFNIAITIDKPYTSSEFHGYLLTVSEVLKLSNLEVKESDDMYFKSIGYEIGSLPTKYSSGSLEPWNTHDSGNLYGKVFSNAKEINYKTKYTLIDLEDPNVESLTTYTNTTIKSNATVTARINDFKVLDKDNKSISQIMAGENFSLKGNLYIPSYAYNESVHMTNPIFYIKIPRQVKIDEDSSYFEYVSSGVKKRVEFLIVNKNNPKVTSDGMLVYKISPILNGELIGYYKENLGEFGNLNFNISLETPKSLRSITLNIDDTLFIGDESLKTGGVSDKWDIDDDGITNEQFVNTGNLPLSIISNNAWLDMDYSTEGSTSPGDKGYRAIESIDDVIDYKLIMNNNNEGYVRSGNMEYYLPIPKKNISYNEYIKDGSEIFNFDMLLIEKVQATDAFDILYSYNNIDFFSYFDNIDLNRVSMVKLINNRDIVPGEKMELGIKMKYLDGSWDGVGNDNVWSMYGLQNYEKNGLETSYLHVLDKFKVELIFEPKIIKNPSNISVGVGDDVSFTTEIDVGIPVATGNWQYRTSSTGSWIDLSETSTTLSLNNVTYAMNGYEYRYIASNKGATIEGLPAVLTVNDIVAPEITLREFKDGDIYKIEINVIDIGSGVSHIILPDGSRINSDSYIIEAETNINYTFRAYDLAGNEASKSIMIGELEAKSVSSNLDIYIKSENMISISLNTNSVIFDDFSGVDDVEQPNAINIIINSSLPYQINAYLANEIQNSDKSKIMDKSILNIKANSESIYNTFSDTVNPIVLLDDQNSGNDISHGIDLKLKGNIAHEKDVYKTTIKFEVKQK